MLFFYALHFKPMPFNYALLQKIIRKWSLTSLQKNGTEEKKSSIKKKNNYSAPCLCAECKTTLKSLGSFSIYYIIDPRYIINMMKFFLNVKKKIYLDVTNILFLIKKNLNYVGVDRCDMVEFVSPKATWTTRKNIVWLKKISR
jgi:hypothetical protein